MSATANGNGQAQNGNGNGKTNGNGQIVSFKQRVNDVRGLLERMKDQLQMALPQHFKVDRFLRVALTAVQKTPELLDCYQPTFLGALVEAAQLGLEPNTTLGHAYLIPFRNRKAGRLDCQLIPGYKGLIRLAYQSGQVASFRGYVVRAKDKFDYGYGLSPHLTHIPYRGQDAGEMVAAYCVAKLKDSDEPEFRVLERWEAEAIRDRFSKAANFGPWKDNFDEMALKSVARRLCKWLPADTEKSHLARAIDLDERAEAGIGQEFSDVIDIAAEEVRDSSPADGGGAGHGDEPSIPAGQPTKLDKLAADAKARREGGQQGSDVKAKQDPQDG